AASSTQKSNFSSLLNDVLPFGASTITTFFVRQLSWPRPDAEAVQMVIAIRSNKHSRMVPLTIPILQPHSVPLRTLFVRKPCSPSTALATLTLALTIAQWQLQTAKSTNQKRLFPNLLQVISVCDSDSHV